MTFLIDTLWTRWQAKRRKAAWIAEATRQYQTRAAVPYDDALGMAETLYDNLVHDLQEFEDDPEGAVLEDLTYWTE